MRIKLGPCRELAGVDLVKKHILVDPQRVISTVQRDQGGQVIIRHHLRNRTLLVSRLDVIGPWKDPDLKEMSLHIGHIELGVQNSNTSRHPLHVTGGSCLYVPHGVLMDQRSRFHVGDDFHVLVSVDIETAPSLNPVIVNDAENRETQKSRVILGTK